MSKLTDHWERKRERRGFWLKAKWALAVGLPLFSAPYVYQTARVLAAQPDANFKADAIVVPTGSKDRIPAALRMRTDNTTPVFISGVDPKITDPVLENALSRVHGATISFAELNVASGRDACNTVGNAIEIVDWLNKNPNIQNIIVVSSGNHLPRLRLELERVLPGNVGVRYAASDSVWRTSLGVPVEIGKTTLALFNWSNMINDLQRGRTALAERANPAP